LRFLLYNIGLVRHLVRRDFVLNYRRSALGLLWSLLLPLGHLVVLVFVFAEIVPLDIEAYPAFLFSALLPWTWFSTSVNAAGRLFLNNRDLLRRPNFAPATLMVVSALSNLLTYLAALPVLVAILAWYGRTLTPAVAALVVLLPVEGVLIVGLGLVVATLNVFYRDVEYIVSVLLWLLFYLTPVFYRLPQGLRWAGSLYVANPMAALIEGYRRVFFEGHLPDWNRLVVAGLMSVGAAALGYAVYRLRKHDLVDAL